MAALAMLAMAVATWGGGRSFRGARYAWPFALMVGLPLLQVVPLPLRFRALLDPNGNELLQNAPPPAFTNFPLSLDPSTTQVEVLRAALALMVFLVCLNLSSGRRGQGPLILKVIAGAALVGVLIGIAHPVLNFDRVYDHWGLPGGSPTLVGPFVNPNHNAQFFELGAFVAVACAFLTQDRLGRVAWVGVGASCGAAALVTLSRGSLVGLMAGGLALMLFLPGRRADTRTSARVRMAVPLGLGLAGLTAALSVALGALPIIDEIARTRVTQPGEKTEVWVDALKVLRAHPAGIGRGAFDRVYPAYRTLPDYVQQNFVENEPLQLLIDLGWGGFVILLVAVAYVLGILRRRRLGDPAEAAMIGALAALLAHNVFDFGLETLGLRLLFVAVAGVFVGRLLGGRRPSGAGPSKTWAAVVLATVGFTVGLASLLTAAPFDEQLAAARGAERANIAVQAARKHPTDYFYPLTQAHVEPLKLRTTSPRLSALNRAMRLCPRCADVHRAAAAALWQLNLRGQALEEYRLAMDLEPARMHKVLDDLYSRGASHEQIASLRARVPSVALGIAQTLVQRQAKGAAPRQALDRAENLKVNPVELRLLRIQLAFTENDNDTAQRGIAALLKHDPRSAQALYLQSQLQDRKGNHEAALATATLGSEYNPHDLNLARQRLHLALTLEAWGELERALEGLKRALQAAGAGVADVYFFSAQAHIRRGNIPRAMRDYQTAINIDPTSVSAWYHLGATAEQGGFFTQAVDAYRGALEVQPDHAPAKAGLARIETLRSRSNVDSWRGTTP